MSEVLLVDADRSEALSACPKSLTPKHRPSLSVEEPQEVNVIQRYAKVVGLLLLLSIVAGGVGEGYVPMRIMVKGNAAATAATIASSEPLFRLGFAAYLVEGVCDVTLALLFYFLLRPVRNDLALLAAFFGLVSMITFAFAEFFYFAALRIVGSAHDLKSFSPDQWNTAALMSLRFYGLAGGLFMLFYGLAWIVRGFLIFRSEYLPKFLGVIFILAGLGFLTRNVALVLMPDYASDLLLLPMFIAMITMTVWMFTKGIDTEKWKARVGSLDPGA
jgi:hypothetical protein